METVIIVVVVVGFILVMRWLGSWMLRIDEVIDKLNEVIIELTRLNNKS
jgi:hypothetical protein